MTTMRPLTEEEVTFKFDIEPEDTAPDFDDADTKAWIAQRLANEQLEAWCYLQVTATYQCAANSQTYSATAGLGGVSIDAGRNASGIKVAKLVEAFARDSDLHTEALEALNEHLRETIVNATALAKLLEQAPPLEAEASNFDRAAKRPRYSAGLTPASVIDRYVKRHCGEQQFWPMCTPDNAEKEVIDAAFAKGGLRQSSHSDGNMRLHVDEFSTFCGHLQSIADDAGNAGDEVTSETAGQLRSSMIDCIGIEEV